MRLLTPAMCALFAVAFGLAVALAPVSVRADSFQDGKAAFERGDHTTAVRLLRPLAEQGNAKAQGFLGAMYANGFGVAQDYVEAVRWFRLAAEQGNALAQIILGRMYYDGRSVVPQDFTEAHMWLNLAASRLPPGEERDFAADVRDDVAARMTPDQIAEAQWLAREWEPK